MILERRMLLASFGAAATLRPFEVLAQSGAKPVIAHLHAGSARDNRHVVQAFEEGLAQAGFVPGQNVIVEYHWADGYYDRLPAMARELALRHFDVLAVGTPVAARAVRQATLNTTTPVVFTVGSDPVRDGLVASLSRPGGNITGTTFFSNLLTAKRFGLLHELVPRATRFAVLRNPKNATADMQMGEAAQAAKTMGLEFSSFTATDEQEIEKAFEQIGQQKPDALLILSDSILNSQAGLIAKLALRHGLPTCFAYREPTVMGGLMSYGASVTDADRKSGQYAGRILKGEKPASLPVQQPAKFEFVINVTTAKALGLTVPNSMQFLADEVIE
jgi:putative ABC transport system substrate-binding protein